MNLLNIVFIVIIIFIVYKISFCNEVVKSPENYNNLEKNIIRHKKKNMLDDLISNYSYGDVISPKRVKPNLLNLQFHNDYRDTITAFNNLVPEKKQYFNLPNLPLQYNEVASGEVKNIVLDFIEAVNDNLVQEVPTHRNPNSGWDEAVVDPTVESGWDKVQKALGLVPSLWKGPATKNRLYLVNIEQVQKYETEDEVKYSCTLVLQKEGVEDQMLVKADFVRDKRPLRDENNFFFTTNVEINIVIENVFILGYLSDQGNDHRLQYDGDAVKFYDYNKLEHNNLVDPQYIMSELEGKYKKRTKEMQQRNAMLDEEGQAFHRELPSPYDLSNIRETRSIIDDMTKTKTFV
jgi:hypothetical protein